MTEGATLQGAAIIRGSNNVSVGMVLLKPALLDAQCPGADGAATVCGKRSQMRVTTASSVWCKALASLAHGLKPWPGSVSVRLAGPAQLCCCFSCSASVLCKACSHMAVLLHAARFPLRACSELARTRRVPGTEPLASAHTCPMARSSSVHCLCLVSCIILACGSSV